MKIAEIANSVDLDEATTVRTEIGNQIPGLFQDFPRTIYIFAGVIFHRK